MNKEFWKLHDLLLEDNLQKANVVIWLQGDRFDRVKNVLEIYKSKLAKVVIISGNNILIGADIKIGENNISLIEMYDYLLENGVEKKDIIIDDKAFNTKDQAMHIAKLIKLNNWKKAILVSSAYNQPRALLTFLKQIKKNKLKIDIYNFPVIMNVNKKPGGRTRSVKDLCVNEIKKIKEYEDDLMPIGYGIKYINNTRL